MYRQAHTTPLHLLKLLAAGLLLSACGASSPSTSPEDDSQDVTGSGGATAGQTGPVTSSSGPSGSGGAGGDDSASSTGGTSLHGSVGSGGAGGSSSSSSGSGGGPVNQDCCTPSMIGGCADTQLNACVCAVDNYCCDTEWDAICVSIAQNNCNACPNAQCTDTGFEPSETEATAHNVTGMPITDCNSAGGTISGTIDGPGDVDWYVYSATDELGCVVDPARTLQSVAGGVRLCKYFECHVGPTNVQCPIGTTAENSGDGRPGCCGTYGFQLDDLDCPDTISDDAWVYIRVDQPNAAANTCNHYAVGYHY